MKNPDKMSKGELRAEVKSLRAENDKLLGKIRILRGRVVFDKDNKWTIGL